MSKILRRGPAAIYASGPSTSIKLASLGMEPAGTRLIVCPELEYANGKLSAKTAIRRARLRYPFMGQISSLCRGCFVRDPIELRSGPDEKAAARDCRGCHDHAAERILAKHFEFRSCLNHECIPVFT